MGQISADETKKLITDMINNKFKIINDISHCITKIGSSNITNVSMENPVLEKVNNVISIFMLNKNEKYIYFRRFLDLGQLSDTDGYKVRKPLYFLQEKDIHQIYHEYLIGQCITNKIRHIIPNFPLIYGAEKRITISTHVKSNIIMEEKRFLLLERIFPCDHDKWISNCSWTDYLNIFMQVSLALNFLYKSSSFSHNNLIYSNVLLRKLETHIQIPYEICINHEKQILYITTDIIAMITDFSNSYFQLDDQIYIPNVDIKLENNYGILNDIYKFLSSSLYQAYKNGRYDLLEKSRILMSYFHPLYNYAGRIEELIYFIKDAHNNNYEFDRLRSQVSTHSIFQSNNFNIDNFLSLLYDNYQVDMLKILSYNIVNENRVYSKLSSFETISLLTEGYYSPINNIINDDPYIFCDMLYRSILTNQKNETVERNKHLQFLIKSNKDKIQKYLKLLYEDFQLLYDKYLLLLKKIEPVIILTETPEKHRLNIIFLEQYLIFFIKFLNLFDVINNIKIYRDCSILLVECCPVQDKKYRVQMEELYTNKLIEECNFIKELNIKLYQDKKYIEYIFNKMSNGISYNKDHEIINLVTLIYNLMPSIDIKFTI